MKRPFQLAATQVRPIAAACALMALATSAHAVKIELDNPDIQARWDTRLGYSYGVRLDSPSPGLTAGPTVINYDDGDLNFAKNHAMTNRLDVYTEADVQYHGFGVRVSGAGWYDSVYEHGTSNTSARPSPFPFPYDPTHTLNGGSAGQFPAGTVKLAGDKYEMLDAFVFGRTDIGSMPLTFRLGRHALLWGESLFFGANAIAGTMAPIDIAKAQASRNATIKEIIRPVGQLSGQLQISPEVTVGAYYQYKWEKSVFTPAGSYFSTLDALDIGGDSLLVVTPTGAVLTAAHTSDKRAPDSGQGGIRVGFQVPGVDGDFGVYATRSHAKIPVDYLELNQVVFAPGAPPVVIPTGYRSVYPEGIKAYAVSYSTTIDVVNIGVEAGIRDNTPLAIGSVTVLGSSLGGHFDASSNPAYAIGRTGHLNVSTIAVLPANFISRESNVTAELAWNRVLSCSQSCVSNPAAGYYPYAVTSERDAWGWRAVYTPTFRQVLPNYDLNVPVGIGYSPHGRSGAIGPVFVDHGGDATLGLQVLSVDQSVNVTLAYTHFFGPEKPLNDTRGLFNYGQSLHDRDYITLSAQFGF